MQTKIENSFLITEQGQLADSILRSCVHCGFCTATCPTYQLLGDELDGPRGRIYQIKQMLEGHPVTRETVKHLDRCLTCRSCETTCPSGVKYGELLEIGRNEIEKRVGRPLHQKLFRKGLLFILPYPLRFELLLKLGQFFRPFLFGALKKSIPAKARLLPLQLQSHKRKMLILNGCVQPALSPGINHATTRVLDVLGIELISFPGCCGAINHHLSDEENTLLTAKNNIDRILSELNQGSEGIVITASGCGAMLKEYPHLFRNDSEYKNKAEQVAKKVFDLTEIINAKELKEHLVENREEQAIAVHTPCTLQHAQKLSGKIENILTTCGYQLSAVMDKHLCCGSAGTYSITQPGLSRQLRTQRLKGLMVGQPDLIVTANIGCLLHLNQGSTVNVRHWIELIADRINH